MLACFNVMHEPICSGPLVSLETFANLSAHVCMCIEDTAHLLDEGRGG